MNGWLDGQVALVTGGGRGIGRAIGEALAVAGVVEDVEAELGPVTLLVNNAGTAHAPAPL